MPAAATARKPAPRTAVRARRAAPARAAHPARRAVRPAPRLVPVAVGRTAVAVGGIADSRVVLNLTRSKLWIGLLGTLLVGIVGLNVMALSFNAASSKTAGISDELRRENSALVTQIADGLSNERLQSAAVRLGLIVPEPGAILYLQPRPGDAAAAAARLRRGEITIGSAYVAPVAPIVPAAPQVDPLAETPVDPATVAPADPVAPAPETTPAPLGETTTATATDGGGVALP